MKFCDTNEYSITIKDYKVVSYEVIGINTHPYKHEKELIGLENVHFDIYNFTSPNGRVHNLEFTNVKADLFSKNEKQFFSFLEEFLNTIKYCCDNNMNFEDALNNSLNAKLPCYGKQLYVNFNITPIICYSKHKITDYTKKERGNNMYDVMIYDIIIENYKILKYESKGIENPLFRDEEVDFEAYDIFSTSKHELKFNKVQVRLHPEHEEMFFTFLKQFLYIVKILCENGTHGKLATKIAMGKTKHYYVGDINGTFKIEPIVC